CIMCNSVSEMAQIVCGSCRQLLTYLRGARHVQCSCCQTLNLVLEAHQVGQVKCGSCAILLIYPYGASSVRCSCCRFVTEIGAHNIRPPWSEQQGPSHPSTHTVQ
ncbi:zf-LSD1 domain-containing protein, partial [Cephalotus follicularis]